MAEEIGLLKRIQKWLRYARKSPKQAVISLIVVGIPLLGLHLFERRIEIWGDDVLKKHGDSFVSSCGIVLLNFAARHPVWSILLFALALLLGLLVHAYIATNPYSEFEKESAEDKPLPLPSSAIETTTVAPRIDIEVSMVISHGKIGERGIDLFVWTTLTLREPREVEIHTLELESIREGIVYSALSIDDVDQWGRLMWSNSNECKVFALQPLQLRLTQRGNPVQGWAHFRFDLAESQIYNSVLRFKTNAVGGSCTHEFNGGLAFPDRKTKGSIRRKDSPLLRELDGKDSQPPIFDGELQVLHIDMHDVLARLYIVNESDTKRYVRTVSASAEISGTRSKLKYVDHFRWEGGRPRNMEHGWSKKGDLRTVNDPEPFNPLFADEKPLTLNSGEPKIGWVHFKSSEEPSSGPSINLVEALDPSTLIFLIVDSVGKEYPITKTAETEPDGFVNLRNASSQHG
jgi:hypothetical protein